MHKVMDTFSTKPIEEVNKKHFKTAIVKPIETSTHALNQLSAHQRKFLKYLNLNGC